MGAMNKPHHLVSCLVLSLALSVAAFEAWEQGIITIDSNAAYHCLINGSDYSVKGTKVSLTIKGTSLIWMQCNN